MDLLDAHTQALGATRSLVAGIRDDQWDQPSPCEGWTVRELVNHIVTGNLWAGELCAGKTIDEVGDRLDGDVLGDDPTAVYAESARVADQAFRRAGAMDAPVAVSYGPVPGSVYCGHRFLDVLIHGWDVASGTGQDTRLDPELVETLFQVIEPQKDELIASGAFGRDHDVPPGADRQTQLLALLGRHPE